MNHYTVRYYDSQHHRQDVCTYAHDSFEARQVAMESVKFIQDHPNCIDHILLASFEY